MSIPGYRYCGRNFTETEIKLINKIINASDLPLRTEISRGVCQKLGWLRMNGQLKDMSCRVALLRMHRDGLIHLPSPRNGNGNGKISIQLSPRSAPGNESLGGALISIVLISKLLRMPNSRTCETNILHATAI